MSRRRLLLVDFVTVLAFVMIGRHVHDHGIDLEGIASTAWPFCVGLGAGWLALVAAGQAGTSLRNGAAVAIVTVAVGMLLRVVAGQGTAVAFVLVALTFLGAVMLSTRALSDWLGRVTKTPR